MTAEFTDKFHKFRNRHRLSRSYIYKAGYVRLKQLRQRLPANARVHEIAHLRACGTQNIFSGQRLLYGIRHKPLGLLIRPEEQENSRPGGADSKMAEPFLQGQLRLP